MLFLLRQEVSNAILATLRADNYELFQHRNVILSMYIIVLERIIVAK